MTFLVEVRQSAQACGFNRSLAGDLIWAVCFQNIELVLSTNIETVAPLQSQRLTAISRSVCRSISVPVALSDWKTPDLAVTDMRVTLGLISSNSMSIERFMDFALIFSRTSTLAVGCTSICMRWSAARAAARTLGRDAVKVRETVPPSVWDIPADVPPPMALTAIASHAARGRAAIARTIIRLVTECIAMVSWNECYRWSRAPHLVSGAHHG